MLDSMDLKDLVLFFVFLPEGSNIKGKNLLRALLSRAWLGTRGSSSVGGPTLRGRGCRAGWMWLGTSCRRGWGWSSRVSLHVFAVAWL
jgi:hypothetical protein